VSFDRLRPYPDQQRLEQKLAEPVKVAESRYKNWHWSVNATYYEKASLDAEAGGQSCASFGWNDALRNAYELAGYMLGGAPAAITLRVHLIPYGLHYSRVTLHYFTSSSKLKFTFWNPASLEGLPCAKRHARFVGIAATIF